MWPGGQVLLVLKIPVDCDEGVEIRCRPAEKLTILESTHPISTTVRTLWWATIVQDDGERIRQEVDAFANNRAFAAWSTATAASRETDGKSCKNSSSEEVPSR